MIDPAQTALFLVIIILTILLMALGIQVFLILRELRKTVDKANKVLDDTGVITERVANPISILSSLVMGVKTGVSFVNFLKKTSGKLESISKLIKEISIEGVEELSEEESSFARATEYKAKEQNEELKATALSKDDKKPLIRRFFRGISRKT